MDPIGLALDNFDVTGKWRIREHGIPLDTRGTFYDGSDVTTPQELRAVLLERPEPLIRHFTANLMAYALGRRMEYYDQPEIREIARKAAAEGNRMSAFIVGVVESEAFQMKSAVTVRGRAERKLISPRPRPAAVRVRSRAAGAPTCRRRPGAAGRRCRRPPSPPAPAR